MLKEELKEIGRRYSGIVPSTKIELPVEGLRGLAVVLFPHGNYLGADTEGEI